MQHNNTTFGITDFRNFLGTLFIAMCLLFLASYKKGNTGHEKDNISHKPLQLSHGNPTGEKVTINIGSEGGSIASKDGTSIPTSKHGFLPSCNTLINHFRKGRL